MSVPSTSRSGSSKPGASRPGMYDRRHENEINKLIKDGYKVIRNEQNSKIFRVGFLVKSEESFYHSDKMYWLEIKYVYGNSSSGMYEYPTNPPKINFLNTMFHPNINFETGTICLNIFTEQNDWSIIMSIDTVINSIISLLDYPNPDSPLNSEAAKLYNTNNTELYKAAIKEKTKFINNPDY
jgi:ubiquitin-protein ligase